LAKGTTLTSKPKGTLSAYEPSLRDKLAWFLSDMVGGDRGTTNYINQKVRGAADFIPGVGDAIGFDEAKREFDAGNYGSAAFDAATSAIGSIPGAGDLAAVGLKGGTNMAGILGGPMAKHWARGGKPPKTKDLREMFHGTNSPVPFEEFALMGRDAGIHTTNNPNLAAGYAGFDGGFGGLGLAKDTLEGGRVYPVVIEDSGNWLDQLSVMRALKNDMNVSTYGGMVSPFGTAEEKALQEMRALKKSRWRDHVSKDTRGIFDDVAQGAGITEALSRRGYDSMEYYHENPLSWRGPPSEALMTLDPQRVIPKLSPKGLTLSKSPVVKKGLPADFNQVDLEWLIERLNEGSGR
jgi:hypothetical protein